MPFQQPARRKFVAVGSLKHWVCVSKPYTTPKGRTTNSFFWVEAFLLSASLSLLFVFVYGGCNALAAQRTNLGMLFFAWELRIPFVPALILPYMSIDLFFVASFLMCRDRIELCAHARRIAAAILVACSVPRVHSRDHQIPGLVSGLSAKLVTPVSGGMLYGYLMSSLVTLFPLYLNRRGVEEVQTGGIITAVIVGTIVSQVPIARAADRFGKRPVLLASAIFLSGLFWLMTMHSAPLFFVCVGALIGASAGSLYPVALAIIGGSVIPERLGTATALFSLAFGIGSLAGPAMSGLVMDHFGDAWLFRVAAILTAAFSALIPIMHVWIRSRVPRNP